MLETETVQRQESATVVRASPAAFIVSVIGLVIQGLAGLLIYGVASLATAFFSAIPSSITAEWGVNGGPFNPAAAWPILAAVIAYTAAVFLIGLYGTIRLRSGRATDIRIGAALVLVSAVIAVTTGWGLVLGSLLMLTGSVIGFATIHRVDDNPR